MQKKHKQSMTLWAAIAPATDDATIQRHRIILENIVVDELTFQSSNIIDASLQAYGTLLTKEHRELYIEKITNVIQTKEKEQNQNYKLLDWGIERPLFYFARLFDMKQNCGLGEDHMNHPNWVTISQHSLWLKSTFHIENMLDFLAKLKGGNKETLPLTWAICCLLAEHTLPSPITTKSPLSIKHLTLYTREDKAKVLKGITSLVKQKLIETNGTHINIKPLFWKRGIESTSSKGKATSESFEDEAKNIGFFNRLVDKQRQQAQELTIQLLQELDDEPLLTSVKQNLSTFLKQTLLFNHELINENLSDLQKEQR
ncbi:hypothetical protein BS049_RS20280 [Vibrio parahaemolyticus]|nr:hypothetical protein [Vibrio parahaemolyticus]